MRYRIEFTQEAEDDLLRLRASQRREVLDAIEAHLRHEPEKISKSRIKRLTGLTWPQYRLRIGDIRAFYAVYYIQEGGVVTVVAVLEKSETADWLSEYGQEG